MTEVQISKLDTNDSRLLTDSSNQNNLDNAFAEKLKYEQARLGLAFSPLAQLQNLFAYPANFFAASSSGKNKMSFIMNSADTNDDQAHRVTPDKNNSAKTA